MKKNGKCKLSMKNKVYEFVKNIPRGKVATYGQIAEYIGNKKLARVVGNVLHYNPEFLKRTEELI